MRRDLDLQRSYTPDNCDIILRQLYVPPLARADAGDLAVLTNFLIKMNREAIRTLMHEFSFEARQRVLGSGV